MVDSVLCILCQWMRGLIALSDPRRDCVEKIIVYHRLNEAVHRIFGEEIFISTIPGFVNISPRELLPGTTFSVLACFSVSRSRSPIEHN